MREDTILLWQTVIGAVTIFLSVVGAVFAAGGKMGRIESTIHTMSERLARIEALFELRLKGKDE